LPEVETIRRGLERKLVGSTIVGMEVFERRLRRPLDVRSLRSIVGRRVVAVTRRAKYLLLHLGEGVVWLLHLGMSGSVVVARGGGPRGAHEHVRVRFDPEAVLRYSDPRRFGLMRVGREAELVELRGLGVEPLGDGLDASWLHRRLRATRREVKAALLDQRVVAGIGNIYASEILHRAGVRPTRRGVRLRRCETERIAAAIRNVLSEAVERRGTSFSDYFDSDGVPGTFQTVLGVFDRAGLPCPVCGAKVKRRLHGGRSSFYCPACQK
ncbi:MAG: bifunctional DNA-formamidopyrimidine glycosylase/DNA-(apurinic or apyrimidinic site) lyase, partial [Candidatus Binatia bacterium]